MLTQPKKKEVYRPKKTLSQYTDNELISTLNNCDLIEATKLGPICAEILKRMNQRTLLFPERITNHKGPIC